MNLHSALEEQTAQEEKYWESLREKLEEMNPSDDMSDNEEIIELSLSLENINLHCREDGVGSENENIILKDEDNDNENSNDKLREDSSTIREVGIGNEKDNKFGYENTSVIINDG